MRAGFPTGGPDPALYVDPAYSGNSPPMMVVLADPPTMPPEPTTCANTCIDMYGVALGENGVCDDGGDGSEFAWCTEAGTDCTDCGERGESFREKAAATLARAGDAARAAAQWLRDQGLSEEAIVGIAVGVPVGLIVLVICCIAACCTKKKPGGGVKISKEVFHERMATARGRPVKSYGVDTTGDGKVRAPHTCRSRGAHGDSMGMACLLLAREAADHPPPPARPPAGRLRRRRHDRRRRPQPNRAHLRRCRRLRAARLSAPRTVRRLAPALTTASPALYDKMRSAVSLLSGDGRQVWTDASTGDVPHSPHTFSTRHEAVQPGGGAGGIGSHSMRYTPPENGGCEGGLRVLRVRG